MPNAWLLGAEYIKLFCLKLMCKYHDSKSIFPSSDWMDILISICCIFALQSRHTAVWFIESPNWAKLVHFPQFECADNWRWTVRVDCAQRVCNLQCSSTLLDGYIQAEQIEFFIAPQTMVSNWKGDSLFSIFAPVDALNRIRFISFFPIRME